jgi:hypothetical protein
VVMMRVAQVLDPPLIVRAARARPWPSAAGEVTAAPTRVATATRLRAIRGCADASP